MDLPAREDDALPTVVPVEPEPTSIPMTIGVINIVIASIMMLCIFCSSVNLVVQSALGAPMMAMQQQQIQQVMQVEREKQLQRLEEREKAANDEQEKADLKARQKALKAQPVPKMPDFNKINEDVRYQGFMIVDLLSGFILNILMLVAAIALIRRKEWGRVTSIWVAVIKIVRIVALYIGFALVVVPVMVQGFNDMFREMFDEIAKAAPPGQRVPGQAELAQMGTVMGIGLTGFAVAMIVFGVIHPIIVLITLTRQRVKAACTAAAPAV